MYIVTLFLFYDDSELNVQYDTMTKVEDLPINGKPLYNAWAHYL